MRRWAMAVGALGATVAAAAGAQQPVFRTDADTVALYVTVRDRDGHLVVGLEADDFQIHDNGRPAPVTVFSNDPQPITVVLLLDMSNSMAKRFLMVHHAALGFVEALEPGDRVRVGTFGAEVALSPLLTGDKATLRRVISEEVWPGGGTPLWNAIEAGMASIAGEPGRRVVLTITDGGHAAQWPDWRVSAGQVRRRAVNDGVMIYAIGMQGTGLDGAMKDLTDETGGGSTQLSLDADLTAALARVSQELRHQYVLGFRPAVRDGRVHRVEVHVSGEGRRARTRRSYLAPAAR